jgi:hypothetical protein
MRRKAIAFVIRPGVFGDRNDVRALLNRSQRRRSPRPRLESFAARYSDDWNRGEAIVPTPGLTSAGGMSDELLGYGCRLEILPGGDAQNPTLGGSYDRPAKALVGQHGADILSGCVRTKGFRAGLRNIPDRALRSRIQGAGWGAAEQRAVVARDQRERVRRTVDRLADVNYAIGGTAQDGVASDHASDGRQVAPVAFDRHVVGKPVDLSGRVVVDLVEPERFEPARGPWTQVSERVPAVHDHRSGAIKHGGVLLVEFAQRQVDRSRKVCRGVIVPG